LVDIDGFIGNEECGAGETREEFNQFHSNPLGKGIFAIDLIEDDPQDIFRGFAHLDFSSVEIDFFSVELFFLISQ
jgi:hypothetical protein